MRKVIAFALLTLLIVGFIWGNSMRSVEESSAQSAPVAENLRPVLDPTEKVEKPIFHDYIRKMAHVIEFFALGLAVAGFGVSLGSYLKKRLISMPVLMVLLVAVIDEYIQHFTGRGSLVTDVALDFVSALAGLLFVWVAVTVVLRIKNKNH